MTHSEPTEQEVTETIEDPGNAESDMALRSAKHVDDPTGRRAYAQKNQDGPDGAAGENRGQVEDSTEPGV